MPNAQSNVHPTPQVPEEFDPATVDFLFSADGPTFLETMAQADLGPDRTLEWLMRLRREVSPVQAAALLTTARLRQRAGRQISPRREAIFRHRGLGTGHRLASGRASGGVDSPPRPRRTPCWIWAVASAATPWPWPSHRPVIAYELAADRLRFAQANAAALNLPWPVRFCPSRLDRRSGRRPLAGGRRRLRRPRPPGGWATGL